jgi:uncharacterized paraquat-inducible protein A
LRLVTKDYPFLATCDLKLYADANILKNIEKNKYKKKCELCHIPLGQKNKNICGRCRALLIEKKYKKINY